MADISSRAMKEQRAAIGKTASKPASKSTDKHQSPIVKVKK